MAAITTKAKLLRDVKTGLFYRYYTKTHTGEWTSSMNLATHFGREATPNHLPIGGSQYDWVNIEIEVREDHSPS